MTSNKKLKTQDIVVYGLVPGVGLVIIFVVIFTDLVFASSDETPAAASAQSNFNKLNTKVKSEPVAEHDSKLELYDEALQDEADLQRRELEEEEYREVRKERVKINDLSKFLEEEKDSRATANPDDNKIAKPGTNVHSQNNQQQLSKKPSSKPAPQVSNSPTSPKIKHTQKRPKRSDPTFGDNPEPETLNPDPATLDPKSNASGNEVYSAIIQGEQVVKEGSRMTIRLTQQLSIGACSLPANTRLTGVVSIQGQRIHVSFIACQKDKATINLSIYDITDGNEGLYVESLNDGQELKKEALGDAVGETASRFGIPVVDKIARSAGSKKLDSPTVTLQSGTQVSLKNLNRQ
jgi:hypothetical protein